jgi:hypothetical protein
MHWTQESLLKARGTAIIVVGIVVLVAYLIARL